VQAPGAPPLHTELPATTQLPNVLEQAVTAALFVCVHEQLNVTQLSVSEHESVVQGLLSSYLQQLVMRSSMPFDAQQVLIAGDSPAPHAGILEAVQIGKAEEN
jgi:hypothetical protein